MLKQPVEQEIDDGKKSICIQTIGGIEITYFKVDPASITLLELKEKIIQFEKLKSDQITLFQIFPENSFIEAIKHNLEPEAIKSDLELRSYLEISSAVSIDLIIHNPKQDYKFLDSAIGDLNGVKEALQLGADINATDDIYTKMPLRDAIRNFGNPDDEKQFSELLRFMGKNL